MLYLIFCLLATICSAAPTFNISEGSFFGTTEGQVPSKIYDQLYRAGNMTAVAYCASDFTPGGITAGGDVFDCDLDFCEANRDVYDIIEIFNPIITIREQNITATGFIAVSHSRKEILLVFRGSMSITDFITDVELWMIPYTPLTANSTESCTSCEVHRGFQNILEKTYDDVFPVIQGLVEENPDYSIFVTGHSLGGALANLAGIELKLMGYEPLVISLAGPKVGNDNLTKFTDNLFDTDSLDESYRNGDIQELTKGFWRVVSYEDLVPIVPPGKAYTHAGLQIDLTTNAPLPQPNSNVVYSGKYVYSTLLDSLTSSELINLIDWLHIYEHLDYFAYQSSCLAGRLSVIFNL